MKQQHFLNKESWIIQVLASNPGASIISYKEITFAYPSPDRAKWIYSECLGDYCPVCGYGWVKNGTS